MAIHKGETAFESYRVRIETIKQKEKTALCFYIDDGFQEWLSFDSADPKLYQLDRNLFQIPVQAIHFSLFNLEDFAENTDATEVIVKELSDKLFVAKIKSTEAQFKKQLESDDSEPRINVILYDTSTDDDILVNRELIRKICARMQPPQLEPIKTNIVNVTHINESGDIFCRMQGSKEMDVIKQIIHRLTSNGISDAYRVQKNDLNAAESNVLYLVRYESNGKWYRAKILSSISQQSSNALCKFIDYGNIEPIELENIYDLQRLSLALSKYPYQAMTARLHDLKYEEHTPKVIKRLEELLISPKPIYFEVVTRSEFPFVNVWKIVDGLHCNINEAIRREIRLQQ